MFTFADSQSRPQGYIAVEAAGIIMSERFNFNNSAMWSSSEDKLIWQYFEIGANSFTALADFMVDSNQPPVKLKNQ